MSSNGDRQDGIENRGRRRLLKTTGVAGMAGITGLSGCLGGSSEESGELGEKVEEVNFLMPTHVVIEPLGRSVAKQWEDALGLTINRNVIDFTAWLDQMFAGDPEYEDMSIWTWTGAPQRVGPAFILETLTSDSSVNAPKYENPEYDDLYDEMLATFDREERSAVVEQMQEIILEDVPVIEFFRQPQINPVNTTKWNMTPTPLLGTGGSGVQSHHQATPNTDAFDNGEATTLDVGAELRWDRPNPLNVTSGPLSAAMGHVYEPLRRFSTEGSFENWAVDEFSSVDETTIDVTLRDDLAFHDGEPVTAEDLAFSLTMFSEANFPKISKFASTIEEASVETDLTTRINFKQPDSTFLEAGALILKIVPEHIWRPIHEAEGTTVNYDMPVEEAIGSGPFEITKLDSTTIQFEATGDHWSNPDYDAWRMFSYDGSEGLRAALVAGDIDLLDQSPTSDLANSVAEESDEVEVLSPPGLYWFNVTVDNQEGVFSDKIVRQAMLKTVNAREVQQVFFNDQGDIANGTLIHPALDIGGDFERIDQKFDVEEARSMLSDAGYGWDSDDNLHYPAE